MSTATPNPLTRAVKRIVGLYVLIQMRALFASPNGMVIFIGLAMIVLSGVLNEAANMRELQELTI